jgi:hypothetical protein
VRPVQAGLARRASAAWRATIAASRPFSSLIVALVSLVVLVVGTRVAPSLIATMQTASAAF